LPSSGAAREPPFGAAQAASALMNCGVQIRLFWCSVLAIVPVRAGSAAVDARPIGDQDRVAFDVP
jgi:hypothetical protein